VSQIDEFLQLFHDEANERLDRVVEILLALERGRGPADAVESLLRDIHTIKGAAGMVGLDDVRSLAHAVEEVLVGARDEGYDPTLTELMLRAADALRRSVDGGEPPTAELIAELTAAAQGTPAETAAAPVEATPQPAPVREPDPEPEPEPVATPALAADRRSIRVAPEKIDALLDLVGETVLHRRRLEHVLDGDARASQSTSDELDLGARLLGELKDTAVGMRTLPLSSIVAPLPRAVRDLAAEHGRDAELVVEGAETELDRAILEGLSEPLVHLLRNAIAHGIESPAERERAGKPPSGRLVLRAEQRGSSVEVTVADDGRGVSEEVLAEARAAGSLADVLAEAGFSTAGAVSALSGRGAGFGAVKEKVESFGGTVEVHSTPGASTDVVLRLPLALALLEVLLLQRGDTVYGLPLGSVEEVLSLSDTLSLAGRTAIELRGRAVQLADLAELTGQAAQPLPERAPVVVFTRSGRAVAAACDSLLGKEEVVVKSLGPLLRPLAGYLGAAILGDGRIAFLLDPAALAPGRKPTRRPQLQPAETVDGEAAPGTVLVVEDSFIVRELQRSILESAGYRVETAKNGSEALMRLDADQSIELVVSDVDMPEMDGITLTETIRAHPTRSTLPVVIVTSRGEEHERLRGIEAGADAYMVKRGFDQQVLLDTVERLIGR
jgi:two-component system chemotaxis sensor kinase CheA